MSSPSPPFDSGLGTWQNKEDAVSHKGSTSLNASSVHLNSKAMEFMKLDVKHKT